MWGLVLNIYFPIPNFMQSTYFLEPAPAYFQIIALAVYFTHINHSLTYIGYNVSASGTLEKVVATIEMLRSQQIIVWPCAYVLEVTPKKNKAKIALIIFFHTLPLKFLFLSGIYKKVAL